MASAMIYVRFGPNTLDATGAPTTIPGLYEGRGDWVNDPTCIRPGAIIETMEDAAQFNADGTIRDTVSDPFAIIKVPSFTLAEVEAFAVKTYGADGAMTARSVYQVRCDCIPTAKRATLHAQRWVELTRNEARAAIVDLRTGQTLAARAPAPTAAP